MKNKLEEARLIINQIDKEMIELFKQRMTMSKMVAEYKFANKLDILDSSRENILINKNVELLNDDRLKLYYLTFFNGVLASSKNYQEDIIKELDK